MQTLELNDGERMPIVGLGTWKVPSPDAYAAVKEALRLGYRHFDCAAAYENEAEVGRAVTDAIRDGIVTRDHLWITSKLWNDSHARSAVRPALEKTLSDLGLDYVDLYLVHWPVAHRPGVFFPRSADDLLPLDDLPIAETWQGLEEAADAGLCRHVGVSNFSVRKLQELMATAQRKPAMNQIELHPYLQQPGMLTACREWGIHLTAYSALGSGDRPPELKAPDEPILLDDPVVARIGERRGATSAQVLIAWAVQRGTAVIPKSVDPARMRENLAAADLSLTAEDLEAIGGLDRHRRYITGESWTMTGSGYTLANLWDE